MSANYMKLEKILMERYKCTSVDIAKRLYAGRDDIVSVIQSVANMKECDSLFETYPSLASVRDGEKFKAIFGAGGAIDFLKRVVANWIQQDLFIRSLAKEKITCELSKHHRYRDFDNCLSVEPTAVLWTGEPRKSKFRPIDIQIVYGTSMEDGTLTVKREKFLKLIERKSILLSMNMTTLKYCLLDFGTNNTYSEEYWKGGIGIVKILIKDSKTVLSRLGIVKEHIKNILDNTANTETVIDEVCCHSVSKYEVEGKNRKFLGVYTIPERKVEEKEEEPPKKTEVKSESVKEPPKDESAVVEKKPEPVPQKPKVTEVKKTVVEKPKPITEQPKPQKIEVEEGDDYGYDFSSLDSFA